MGQGDQPRRGCRVASLGPHFIAVHTMLDPQVDECPPELGPAAGPYLIIFVEPGKPIPEEQLMRTYQWMVSWNLIDAGHKVQDLVNTDVMPRV